MRKLGPNISAALAVAIERQVGDIIRAAKIRCMLLAHPAFIAAIAELGVDSEAIRSTAATPRSGRALSRRPETEP